VLCAFSFGREYKTTNFKVFVICIAIIDLLTCITLIPAEILKTRHYFSNPSLLACKVKCFFNMLGMASTANVLLVISVDRYRKICQPFKKQLSARLAIACVVAVIAFSFITALPAALICGLQETNMTNVHKTLTTVMVCSAEDKYLNRVKYAYKLGMSMLLLSVSLALSVMYTLITKTIAQHWKRRTSTVTIRFDAILNHAKCSFNENALTPTDGDVDKENVVLNDTFSNNVMDQRHNLMLEGQHEQFEANRKISFSTLAAKHPTEISNVKPDKVARNARIKPTSLRPTFGVQFRRQQSGASSTSQRLPYKSIIWIILTLIFLISFFITAGLFFISTKVHTFEPRTMLWYLTFYRLHFVNNIINPLVYALLDPRFKRSCKTFLFRARRLLHLN